MVPVLVGSCDGWLVGELWSARSRFWAGTVAGGRRRVNRLRLAAGLGRLLGPERVDRFECRLEDVVVAVAGGWAEDHASAGAHDPCGDGEHQVAECLGGAAQGRVLGSFARGAGGGAQVAAERGQVEREQRGGQPYAVGALVAGEQVPARLPEL